MKVKEMFDKLPFKGLCEKLGLKLPVLAKFAPYANFTVHGILVALLLIATVSCKPDGGQGNKDSRRAKSVAPAVKVLMEYNDPESRYWANFINENGIDAIDYDGDTLLLYAVKQKDERLVEAALKSGADPNRLTTKSGVAPALYDAAMNGMLNSVKLLYKYGGFLESEYNQSLGIIEYKKEYDVLEELVVKIMNYDLSYSPIRGIKPTPAHLEILEFILDIYKKKKYNLDFTYSKYNMHMRVSVKNIYPDKNYCAEITKILSKYGVTFPPSSIKHFISALLIEGDTEVRTIYKKAMEKNCNIDIYIMEEWIQQLFEFLDNSLAKKDFSVREFMNLTIGITNNERWLSDFLSEHKYEILEHMEEVRALLIKCGYKT